MFAAIFSSSPVRGFSGMSRAFGSLESTEAYELYDLLLGHLLTMVPSTEFSAQLGAALDSSASLTIASINSTLFIQIPFKELRVVSGSAVKPGACQGTCRVHHADAAFLSDPDCTAMLITTSRSGFKATASMGFQLRVWRDQREGLRSRACRYTA